MRGILAIGTAGLLSVLGAAGAADAANPNVPANSPYAVMGYDAGSDYRGSSGLTEGRAAYVEPDADYGRPGSVYGQSGNDYAPGFSNGAPVSPYRWAYSSEDFPGTEFMGGR